MVIPADELRETLRRLEAKVGQIDHITEEDALLIPVLFDKVSSGLKELQAQGLNLASEAKNFESVMQLYRQKAGVFLRKIDGAKTLQSARQEYTPTAAQWWWFIDEWLAEQHKREAQSWFKRLLAAGVILGILIIAYNRFLAPDPAVREAIGHQQLAEMGIRDGDYETALQEVEMALSYRPEDGELWVMKGCLEFVLESPEAAEPAFIKAQELITDQETFFVLRAQIYSGLGQLPQIQADAEALLELDPQSAYGNFFMGVVRESEGNLQDAYAYYENASQFAHENEQSELYVMARMRLSQLMTSQ